MGTTKQFEGVTAQSFQLLRRLVRHEIDRAIGLATVTMTDDSRSGQLIELSTELGKGFLDSLKFFAQGVVLHLLSRRNPSD